MTQEPDGFCKHCGRGMAFKRKGNRIIKRDYCSGACRTAYCRSQQRAKGKKPPGAPVPPPVPIPEDLQTYTRSQILQWIERARLPNNIKLDIWLDWKQGKSQQPKEAKRHDDKAFTKLIGEAEEGTIINTAALVLARKRTKDRTVKGKPGVLRDRVPEGGDSP